MIPSPGNTEPNTAGNEYHSTTPLEFRKTIPALDAGVYFNWGAGGPIPRRVVDAAASSPAPHAALTEAIDCLESIGLETIQRRIELLTDRLKAGIPDERVLSPRAYDPDW